MYCALQLVVLYDRIVFRVADVTPVNGPRDVLQAPATDRVTLTIF